MQLTTCSCRLVDLVEDGILEGGKAFIDALSS